jgi:hypothetical protein
MSYNQYNNFVCKLGANNNNNFLSRKINMYVLRCDCEVLAKTEF